MRGISARSLAEVITSVDAVKSSSVELGTALFDVVAVLDREPALRRVLTDPSTESSAKVALAAQVFASKLSADALKVVQAAANGRWASGRDLTDGLETAGVTALVAAADAAGDLDAVETELFEVGNVVRSDQALRQAVSDRSLPAAAKGELLNSLLNGKVNATTLALTVQASVARTGSFERVLAAFAQIAADRRSRLVAEVRSAYELDDAEKGRLAAALGAKYGREVHLNIVVDPSVIGGLSVSLGDEVVDGSMSSRLEAARRLIAG
jgi:F-type H+-transporting ATPase subunit delta